MDSDELRLGLVTAAVLKVATSAVPGIPPDPVPPLQLEPVLKSVPLFCHVAVAAWAEFPKSRAAVHKAEAEMPGN